MTVVPEGPCCGTYVRVIERQYLVSYLTGLVGDLEVIEERMTRSDGALVHRGTTVSPVGPLLEQPVPMLPINVSRAENIFRARKQLTTLVDLSIVWFVKLSITLSWKRSPYSKYAVSNESFRAR